MSNIFPQHFPVFSTFSPDIYLAEYSIFFLCFGCFPIALFIPLKLNYTLSFRHSISLICVQQIIESNEYIQKIYRSYLQESINLVDATLKITGT